MPHKDNIHRYPKKEKDWVDWKVRPAVPDDAPTIVKLAQEVKDYILPYALSEVSIRNYIYRWVIVYDPKTKVIGGAEHSLPSNDFRSADFEFLKNICQCNEEVINEFTRIPLKVMKCQPICPGKGTLKALIDWQKENYEEVWIWLSVKSTIRDFCIKNGITFETPVYTFLNVWKADTSVFSVGKWKKSELSLLGQEAPLGRQGKWNLRPIESTPEEAHKRLVEFHLAMDDKWSKGSKKYGPVFQTDPFEEAMNECLDLALYAKVIYFRIKALQERTEESR